MTTRIRTASRPAQKTLIGRTAAVIGGANGIGRETVEALVRAGARTAIGDRDADAAERVAKEIAAGRAARAASTGSRAESGADIFAHAVDVTDPASIVAFVSATEERFGPIDILVNSAGVMWVGPFDEEPDGAARSQVAVNLVGVMNTIKSVAPRMRERRRGHIITIASAASILPTPGEATYAATKHGVLGYLKAVRTELHGSRVDLSVIMPTVVDTALAAGTGTGSAKMLQPEDIARAVIGALARPKFEVAVPGYVLPVYRFVNILPGRIRDAVLRRMVPDQVRSVDRSARKGYEGQFGDEH